MEKKNIKALFKFRLNRERRGSNRYEPEPNTTILIADESRSVVDTLDKMLTQAGYSTIVCLNGDGALAKVKQETIHFIFLNIVLPEMNGFKMTRILRQMPKSKNIPIVLMSSSEQPTDRFWILRVGATDFLAKPFERRDVFEKIDVNLHGLPAYD